MKKLILLAFAMFAAVAVMAQPGGGGFGGPGGGMGGMRGGWGGGSSMTIQDPAEQAKAYVDKMKEAGMDISDKQEKSLVKLYTNHFGKIQTLNAQIQEQEKYTEQRLTTEILTPEQATKWKEVKNTVNRRGRGNRGENGQNNGDRGNFEMMGPPPGGFPGGGFPGGGPGM